MSGVGESRHEDTRLALDRVAPQADSYETLEPSHVLDYVRALYKRRWIVISIFLMVLIVAVLEAFSGAAEYEAHAQLLIEPTVPQIIDFKSVSPTVVPGVGEEAFYQTQLRILQSRTLARRTLDTLKLWDHPQFGGRGEGVVAEQRNLSVRRILTRWYSGAVDSISGWLEPKQRATAVAAATSSAMAESRNQSRAIDSFLGQLSVTLVRDSRLVIVSFRAGDPALATQVSNALATGYIDLSLESRFIAAKDASTFLAQRLTEQRKSVEASEQALQRYREQNDAVSLDDKQNIVVQKLADLNAAVTRAKTTRIEKEALYNQLRNIQNDRTALDSIPAILSHAYIQQMKVELANLQRQEEQLAETLGDRHPERIKTRNAVQLADARLQGEVAKVVQSIHNEYLAAEAQEKSLMAALDSQKGEAQSLNRKAIEYNALERDASTNRQVFENLLQRSKETGITEELKASNARVIDPAEVPRGPVTRNRGRNVLIGILAGLLLGVAAGFVVDYLDNRIKSPEEIRAHLRIPFLGMIPACKGNGSEQWPLIHQTVPHAFAEAVRGVRTNVLFSGSNDGLQMLLVTSAQPAEGKSVVACNLAVALAQAGKRVFLIDGDLRRATVHTMFSSRQVPGLSNFIVGAAKANDVILRTEVANLWILPSGARAPNPADLLGSKRFAEFLKSLSDHFDWVVVDSPPTLAVTDASVLAHATARVLFVVGSEMTSRGVARAALEQLDRSGAQIIGAVLNRVEWNRHPYYYAEYTKPAYGKYYRSA